MALQDFGGLSFSNPTGAQAKAPATTGQRRGGTTPLDTATVDRIIAEEGAGAIKPTVLGIYGQESSGGTNARRSIDGAIGGMQVIPDTFNRIAKPGERIDNPEDNFRVGVRLLKTMADKFGNDPARLAVGYFSGEGNIATGGDTPYKNDYRDGNGKSVSSYARDLVARVGNAVVPSAKAAEPAPDISKAPKYRDFIAKPQWAGLDDAQKDQARNAYFDRYVAPHLPASQRDGQRDAFLRRAAEIEGPAPSATTPEQPGLLSRAVGAIGKGLAALGDSPEGLALEQAATAQPAPAPSKIGVMGNAPAPADKPYTSRAPVTPEFRDQVNRAYDAATPAEREQMAKADNVVGQLVRERTGQFADAPTTQTAGKLDTRREARAARLAADGADHQSADRYAQIGIERGMTPGTELGTAGASNFDFEAQQAFNKGPLSHPMIRAAVKGYEGYKVGALGLVQAGADLFGANEAAETAARGIASSQRRTAAIGESGDALQRNFEGAVSSIAQQLPALLGGAATGSAAIPMAAMFTQTFGAEYGQGRAQGIDPGQAATRAGLFATFEVIGERFGLGNTLQALKLAAKGAATNDIATVLAKGILKEIPGEQLTTLGQFLTDKVPGVGTNLEAGLAEYLKQAGDTLAQTVMQGGLMMGGTTGVSAGVRHLQGVQTQQSQTLAADQARENALNKAAAFGQPVRPKHASQAAAEQVVREMAADAGMDISDLLPPESRAPAAAPAQPAAPAPTPAQPQPATPTETAYDSQQVLDFAQTRYERLLAKRDGEAVMESGADGKPVDGEIAGQELTPEEQQEMSVLEQSRGDVAALARYYGFDEDAANESQPAVPAATDDPRSPASDAGVGADPSAGGAGTVPGGDGQQAGAAPAAQQDAAAVPGADGAADGQPALTFKTAKGSVYQVHPDGTTTRDKAARADAGHEGDAGKKERSARTIYFDEPVADLSAAGLQGGGKARVIIKGGRATLVTWNEKEGRWGLAPSVREGRTFHTDPAVGRYPLEVWQSRDDVPGFDAYGGMHAGNQIVEMGDAQLAAAPEAPPADPAAMTDDQLRERADYIRQQARANGGWNKMATAERDRVDAEIARRATEQPTEAATQQEATPEQSTAEKIDAAANEAATSDQNDRPQPTEAQQKAGNYAMGHISLHGLDITIENPRGSTRSGTDADGKAWSVDMANHYGYFKRTEGADGDHVDAFIGPNPDSTQVFVVDQVDPRTGKFDEHKVMLGFDSLDAARDGYLANYEQGWKGAGAITPLSMDDFKTWLKDGDTTKPLDPKVGKPKTEKQAKAARAADAPKKKPTVDKPLAAEGLTSYRYKGPIGWIMIGAKDHADALAQVARSTDAKVSPENLQVWDGGHYVDAGASSKAEATPSAAPAKPKKKTEKQIRAERAQALVDYFTPGNVVKSYAGHHEILAFEPATNDRPFAVTVQEVRKEGDEWVRVGKPQDARTHGTTPSARELAGGPVDRVPDGEARYTEPRSDGQPFPNAPRRGPEPAAEEQAADNAEAEAEQGALFSRAAPAGRITADQIRAMIDPIKARWTAGPKGGVVVVQSVDDLPAHLAEYLRSNGEDGRVEGFYLPKSDKVYLIADNLPSAARAQEVVFHEVYGHKGLRAILPGEQYAEMMDRIRRANPKIARAADAWYEQYGIDTVMMNRDAGQSNAEAVRNAELLAVEEALADMAATEPVAGPVRKLLDAVQRALRAIGLDGAADWLEGRSQAETFALLRDARAAVFGVTRNGGTHVMASNAATPAPAFARARDSAQLNLFRLLSRDSKEGSVDTISAWDKTVGTQYNKALKDEHFGRVFGYALAMQNEVSMASVRPAELAPALLPKVDAFGTALRQFVLGRRRDKEMVGATQAIFAGTTAGETVAQGKVWTDEELQSLFGLTERGIKLYRQARAAINASLDEVAAAEAYAMAQGFVPKDLRQTVMHDPAGARGALLKAIDQQTQMLERATMKGSLAKSAAERAEALESALKPYSETRQKVEEIFDRADQLKGAGYAPLMRFGKYTVYANEVGPNGEVLRDEDDQPKTLYFGIFETEAEAIRVADKLRARYADRGDVRVTRGKKDQKGHELFTGISPETVALFGDVIGKDEATQKFYQQALSERSALKRRLGRRAIEGYSTDLPRVLANFITSNGRFAAQRYYLRDLNNAIRSVPKSKGDVKDEAITLRNYLMDANDGGAGASTLMFAYFLGGSVASAVVNLSQPFMMTGPYLSQWGTGRAAAAMAKALPYALGKKQIADQGLREALKRANQEGIVEAQEIFHLYSQGAQGVSAALARRLASIPKVGAKLGESTESMRARMEGFMTLWGMMFAAAESFNRKLTFASAWELAKATDQADPYEFAARAVNETQGIFNKVNRPNWARSTPGRLLMTFKQYSIMYLELTRRMWRAGPQGKKAVLLMMAVLFVASGEEGLPFAQDIADLIDTIGQALGYDTNLLRDKRKWAHKILGQTAGDFALYGISSMMPLDFAGRVGLGNLIPGTGLLKPAESKDRTREITDVIGPAGALVSAGMDSYDAWTAKQPGRAVMAVMPKAIGNAAAGIEMAMTDKAVDYKGRKVTDVGLAESVVKGLGFTPTKVAQDTRRRMPARQDIALVQKTQADILDLWTRGLSERNQGMQERAAAWLKDWNEKNPESPILITNKQLQSRVKQMATPSADRMLKNAPKGLRGRLAGQLSAAQEGGGE